MNIPGMPSATAVAAGALAFWGCVAGQAFAATPSLPISISCESVGEGAISPKELCDILASEIRSAFPDAKLTDDLAKSGLHLFLHVEGPRGPKLEGDFRWTTTPFNADEIKQAGMPAINISADRKVDALSYRALVRELIRVNGPLFMNGR